MEERLSMRFLIAACLAGSLLLAGCASTTTPTAGNAGGSSNPGGSAAPVYPSGPLTPITAGQATSKGVTTLAPPGDMWERIRRGFKMPDLDNDLVHEREQWYSSGPTTSSA
jgi:membrane-bound lytic murein transglycosylase D